MYRIKVPQIGWDHSSHGRSIKVCLSWRDPQPSQAGIQFENDLRERPWPGPHRIPMIFGGLVGKGARRLATCVGDAQCIPHTQSSEHSRVEADCSSLPTSRLVKGVGRDTKQLSVSLARRTTFTADPNQSN